ncbi:MAG: DUF1566 domain-containing protein, partial [Deltaproteobacteria bacterium]|nr:DUF1566 domain-containing protein [Deltaproteobacteria bacterium]
MKKGKMFFTGLVVWIMGSSGFLCGLPSAFAAYQDNGNGTVTDTSTGLIWQQDTARDGQGNYDTMTWEEALAYCEALNLGGHTDWRLPTIKELGSLVDLSRYLPSINTTFFPNTVSSSGYWSSTTGANGTHNAWGVYFRNGSDDHFHKSSSRYVRSVRSGQSGSFDYLDHFVISTVSSSQALDTPFNITITVSDAAGNRVWGFNGSVSLSVPGGVYPKSATLSSGQTTVSVRLYSGGWTRINCSGYGVYGYSNCFDVSGGSACSGKIFGKVIDAKGAAVNQADVRLYSCQGQVVSQGQTDANGKFSFSGLSCGAYEIKAEKDGHSSEPVDVSVASTLAQKLEDLRLQINAGTEETPVILVPGIMGSTLPNYIFPELGQSVPCRNLEIWNLRNMAGWGELREQLDSKGFKVCECPWDWRMKCEDVYKAYLMDKIEKALENPNTGSKVHIVAHSMGGLVVRAYIQSKYYRGDIDKVAMVGTPNLGSCNPYYIWEGG